MKKGIILLICSLAAALLFGCTTANATHVVAPDNLEEIQELIENTTTTSGSSLIPTITTITTTVTITIPHLNSEIITDKIITTETVVTTLTNIDVFVEESLTEPVEIIEESSDIENFESVQDYIVYKPSTHYVHTSTCHWVDDTCYEIIDTKGLESRRCSECNPDIIIESLYIESTPVVATINTGIDDYNRTLLAEIVQHEAGADWISIYNKAKIAAGVMNRVNDVRFPSTIYGVLTQSGQFSGYWPGCCTPSQACYDAVDYYFSHVFEFNSDNSWYGTGYENIFYYQ